MAYYLQKPSAFSSATVDLVANPQSTPFTSFDVATGAATQVSYDLEFEAKVGGTDLVLASVGPSTTRLIFLKSDNTFELRESSLTFNTPFAAGFADFHKFTLQYRETDNGAGGYNRIITLLIDDAQAATYDFGASRPDLAFFGQLFALGSSTRHGSIKYYAFTDNLNPAANNRYYDANASNGTGDILPETTGNGAGGTLLNFPADDTQKWLFSASGPTITDINTNETVTPGATATLTGTALTGATGINIGSVSQTGFTVTDDTTVTFTGTRGGNPYSQNLTATLLHPDGNATITVQQVPAAGFAVTAASPNTTDDASLWTGLVGTATGNPVTVVDGDQALVTDPNNLGNLAVTPAGEISADTTGNFTVQFWQLSEGVWGGDQTVAFTDTVAPAITSVSVPAAGTYALGNTLTFTPNWNEAVTVTGVPAINLDIGGSARQANYASGSGTTATAFTYTVQSGDLDTDGVTVTSLTLDGGTIKDSAGNDATLTLNAVGDTSGVLVDGVEDIINSAQGRGRPFTITNSIGF